MSGFYWTIASAVRWTWVNSIWHFWERNLFPIALSSTTWSIAGFRFDTSRSRKFWSTVKPQSSYFDATSGVAILKFGREKNLGSKMFDFRRATVFLLEHRFSKHKIPRYAKNVEVMAYWLHLWMQPFFVLGNLISKSQFSDSRYF